MYQTHVTFVPDGDDPWQVPLGAMTAVETTEDPPGVVLLERSGARTVVGQLARRRDEFHREVAARRDAQGQLLGSLTGSMAFADGLGVPRGQVAGFEAMVGAVERAGSRRVRQRADRPDARRRTPARAGAAARPGHRVAGRARSALPEHWASFLLVPAGSLTVLEILAGPSAATYVFEAPIEAVNRDLQLLHFRRGALALRGPDAELTPTNPWRLALRRLEPLRRLRAATRARIIHNEGWREALRNALTSA